jgi:hypothetical protein
MGKNLPAGEQKEFSSVLSPQLLDSSEYRWTTFSLPYSIEKVKVMDEKASVAQQENS